VHGRKEKRKGGDRRLIFPLNGVNNKEKKGKESPDQVPPKEEELER